MRNDKNKAFLLRKSGKSYKEIRDLLGIPKSTISNWFGNEEWSVKISKDLMHKHSLSSAVRLEEISKIRGENLRKLYETAKKDAAEEFERLIDNPLFFAGLVIYWGEGDKVGKHQVRISNTDPNMIKIFVEFLKRIVGPNVSSRIWLQLVIYPDLTAAECIKYWSVKVGIDEHKFYKCSVIKGRHKKRLLSFGTCSAGISSRYLKEKMLIWLSLLPEKFRIFFDNADMV